MDTIAPVTVADLFRDLPNRLERHPVVREQLAHVTGLTAATARLLHKQLTDALAQLLDVDLAGVVVDGWKKHNDLRAAARHTVESPGRTEEVVLADHQISSEHKPSVEVYLGNTRVATVEFGLQVWVEVMSVVAVVRAGRLVAIRSGTLDVGATVSVAGRSVAERRTRCAAGTLIRLGSGVPLVDDPGSRRARPTGSNGAGSQRRGCGRVVGLVALLLVAVVGVGSALTADPPPPPPPGVVGKVGPGPDWHLRTGPTQNAPSVGTIPPGTEVRVACMHGKWARLLAPRDGVYVHSRELQLGVDPPDCT